MPWLPAGILLITAFPKNEEFLPKTGRCLPIPENDGRRFWNHRKFVPSKEKQVIRSSNRMHTLQNAQVCKNKKQY